MRSLGEVGPAKAVMAVGLAAALGGCASFGQGSGDQAPPAGTTAPAQAEGTLGMEYSYQLTDDASSKLAAAQEAVGLAAVQSAVMAPFSFTIDGQPYTVRVSVPSAAAARQHSVIFTANSEDAGQVFDKLANGGDKGLGGSTAPGEYAPIDVSATVYDAVPGPAGIFHEAGSAVSVIGQESGVGSDSPGRYDNAATEYCQGLDVTAIPAIRVAYIFRLVKEAVCNAEGEAASTRVAGGGYTIYRLRLLAHHVLLGNAAAGHVVVIPQLNREQFEALAAVS